MALEIRFELTDQDVDRFRSLFRQARASTQEMDQSQILAASKALLKTSLQEAIPEFMRQKLEGLHKLVEMAMDEAWRLPEDERNQIVDALSYFAAPNDVIPDSTPVLGLLDDAIAAELVLQSLKHELRAYEEFQSYRSTETEKRTNAGLTTDVSKEDWLADRRATLHSRMREHRAADPVGWHTITLWGSD